jgi:hypothetical protein
MLRLEQMCAEEAIGFRKGLSCDEEGELPEFLKRNRTQLDTLTIRTFLDACDLVRKYPADWRERMNRYFDRDALSPAEH